LLKHLLSKIGFCKINNNNYYLSFSLSVAISWLTFCSTTLEYICVVCTLLCPSIELTN
jgi:hypothetical protein